MWGACIAEARNDAFIVNYMLSIQLASQISAYNWHSKHRAEFQMKTPKLKLILSIKRWNNFLNTSHNQLRYHSTSICSRNVRHANPATVVRYVTCKYYVLAFNGLEWGYRNIETVKRRSKLPFGWTPSHNMYLWSARLIRVHSSPTQHLADAATVSTLRIDEQY